MQTIFVRHNLSHTPKMLQTLWDRRLIALHYDDITSTDPKDYSSSGQKALTTLWRLC